MTSADTVLHTLYRLHYLNHEPSEVTSSHWRSVGWQEVRKSASGWDLDGGGFGSRRRDGLVNRILRWPSTRMTYDLLRESKCPHELIEMGIEIARMQGRLFDYDCARQVLTLDLLAKRLPEISDETRRGCSRVIAVIGDGYGYLASLLGRWLPKATIVEINLGRTLFFDAYYLAQAFPTRSHSLVVEGDDLEVGEGFRYLAAELASRTQRLGAWLYINIASMQEMDIPVVQDYFRLMRAERSKSTLFYCCNRDEKRLPDGTVTRYADYGWRREDEILLDELCPWYQKYPKSYPPKWLPFDGPIRHRLAKLACGP